MCQNRRISGKRVCVCVCLLKWGFHTVGSALYIYLKEGGGGTGGAVDQSAKFLPQQTACVYVRVSGGVCLSVAKGVCVCVCVCVFSG